MSAGAPSAPLPWWYKDAMQQSPDTRLARIAKRAMLGPPRRPPRQVPVLAGDARSSE